MADPQERGAAGPDVVKPLAFEALPADLQSAITTRWRRSAAAHADVSLAREPFAQEVLDLWAGGRGRQGLPAGAGALRDDLARIHWEDLYLARRCERGDEQAWRAFTRRYAPDLRRVLERHADSREAEEVAAAVVAEVALPPARRTARTLLGTYEGSGPLWAWLATIGIRRLHGSRRRREKPLEAAGEPFARTAAPPGTEDVGRRFLGALQRAWRALEPREALAVRWKYDAGLSQRRIARLLAVSEPTVSRIVQRAVTKLRGRLQEVVPDLPHEQDELWPRLEAALAHHFATLPPSAHRKVERP